MFKKIAIIIVLLIAVIFIYAATRPDTFRIERSTSINAPCRSETFSRTWKNEGYLGRS